MFKIKQLLSRILPSPAHTFHKKIYELLTWLYGIKESIGALTVSIKCNNITMFQRIDVLEKRILDIQLSTDKYIDKIVNRIENSVHSLSMECKNDIINKIESSTSCIQSTSEKYNNEIIEAIENAIISLQLQLLENKKAGLIIQSDMSYLKDHLTQISDDRVLFNHAFDRGIIDSFIKFKNNNNFEEIYINLIRGMDGNSRKTLTSIHRRMELIYNTKGAVDVFTQEEQKILRHQTYIAQKSTFKVSDGCFCMEEYMLPINRFLQSVFYDKCCESSIHNMREIRQKHIIDAGAFIGDSLLIFSGWTSKHVHCFEAMSENYYLLEKTIQMNNISNAVTIKAAIGEKAGKQKFTFRDAGTGSSATMQSEDATELVDVVALDDYVAENNLEVGLIKVDIEGAEQLFLKGAKDTICKQRPTLLISIYHNPEEFYLIKPEIESWNLGYKFRIHKPIVDAILTETVLVAEVE